MHWVCRTFHMSGRNFKQIILYHRLALSVEFSMSNFIITVTYLNGTYHGRGDGNTPEWPPSPMRLFQALVAVAGAKWRTDFPEQVQEALDWLASQSPPEIFSPTVQVGTPYQTSVPNNAMDIVGRAWSKGSTSKDAQVSTHKAMKEISSTYLIGNAEQPWQSSDESSWQVSYVWKVDSVKSAEDHLNVLKELASSLYEVGWGLDLVAGHASLDGDLQVQTKCWSPSNTVGTALRTPRPHAREALQQRHARFLGRVSESTLIPVPPLSPMAYEVVQYRCTDDPTTPTFAAFSFLDTTGAKMRSFNLLSGMQVAGMLRHAAATVATDADWPEEVINRLICGHGESKTDDQHQPVGRERFAYIPLPSLEPRSRSGNANHVGMIRRALIYIPSGGRDTEVNSIRRLLSGMELISKRGKQVEALITALPASDKMVTRYVPINGASTWSTVTPVILPGRDDRKEKKAEKLLRKCIIQAGYSEYLAKHALIDWRPVGYHPGAEHVKSYQCNVPKHLDKYPRYHVKITWRNADGSPLNVHGPIVLGGGRYYGIGLFVAEDSQK